MRLNRQEVVEEDRLSKLPKNFHQRQERAEWKLNDIKKRKMCEENGIDYDQHKLLDVSARDAEKIEKAKAKKKKSQRKKKKFRPWLFNVRRLRHPSLPETD